jgi:hypothetical protein
MKRNISVGACIVLMLMAAFVSVQITSTYMTNKYESVVYGYSKWSDINSYLDTIESIAGNEAGTNWQNVYSDLSELDAYVRTNYIGEIDEENLNKFVLAGYLYGIEDKYAAYLPEEEYTPETIENDAKYLESILHDNTDSRFKTFSMVVENLTWNAVNEMLNK